VGRRSEVQRLTELLSLEQGHLEEAQETLKRLSELGGNDPRSMSAVLVDTSAARIHFAAGQWDVALVELDAVLAWHEAGSTSWADVFAFRAAIAVHRGDLAGASQDLGQVKTTIAAGGGCQALDHFMLTEAFLHHSNGHVGGAAEVLRVAWQIAEDVPLTLAQPNIGPHLARWSATRTTRSHSICCRSIRARPRPGLISGQAAGSQAG
jgi:hypothetical protein